MYINVIHNYQRSLRTPFKSLAKKNMHSRCRGVAKDKNCAPTLGGSATRMVFSPIVRIQFTILRHLCSKSAVCFWLLLLWRCSKTRLSRSWARRECQKTTSRARRGTSPSWSSMSTGSEPFKIGRVKLASNRNLDNRVDTKIPSSLRLDTKAEQRQGGAVVQVHSR